MNFYSYRNTISLNSDEYISIHSILTFPYFYLQKLFTFIQRNMDVVRLFYRQYADLDHTSVAYLVNQLHYYFQGY